MKYVADQTLPEISGGKSQVVFFRSSSLGAAISASLYDITQGEPEFIGIMENDTKIAYATSPGKHIFMVVSEAADFLKADLESGKMYYAIVTPRFGVWKARFSLRPIRRDGTTDYNTTTEDFEEWMEDTELVVNTEESHQWFQSNLSDIKAKQAEYWLKWQQKSDAEKAEVTLRTSDGA
ncbi:MAG: hypothetical protein WD032_08170 [Nitrospirales bacterium]